MDIDKHGKKEKLGSFVILLFSFLILTQGCEPKSSSPIKPKFSPTQNGFGVVVQEIGIDSGPGAGLYYKGTNEIPILVWPCIGTAGYPILYTNNIALLLADKPDELGRMGNGALIAVQAFGPAMDISDDVLKVAVEQNHVNFKEALKSCEPLRLNQETNAIKVVFVSYKYKAPTIPEGLEVQITWDQVFEIMQDVKASGKTNIVVNTDVLYRQNDFRTAHSMK